MPWQPPIPIPLPFPFPADGGRGHKPSPQASFGGAQQPLPSRPFPSRAGGGRDSLLTLVCAPSPRDDPPGWALCSPCFPLSFPAGFPAFSLSLWQDPALSLPFHPKSSWKTPGRAPTLRLHPGRPHVPSRPSAPACGASLGLGEPPPEAPQGTGMSGGHPGIPVPLLQPLPAGTMCGSR